MAKAQLTALQASNSSGNFFLSFCFRTCRILFIQKPSPDMAPILHICGNPHMPHTFKIFFHPVLFPCRWFTVVAWRRGPRGRRKKGAPLYRNCCLLLEVSPRVEYFLWSQWEVRQPEITLALFPSEKEESINTFNPVFLQFHSALFGLARSCSSPASGYRGESSWAVRANQTGEGVHSGQRRPTVRMHF